MSNWPPVKFFKAGPVYIIRDTISRRATVACKGIPGAVRVRLYPLADARRWIGNKTARLALWLTPWPIYYIEDGTDCDHCRRISSHKARNGREYLREIRHAYEHAEGLTSIWRCTFEEYVTHEESFRDYIAEAHEDGHPHVVYR